MRRREFIVGLAGAAAWPLAVWAQQPDRMRRIAALMQGDENDPEMNLRYLRSRKRLRASVGPLAATCGWTCVGGRGDINQIRALAQESVGLRHHPGNLDRCDHCPPAGDANDPDRLYGG
jgi:hypothetical protein